MSGSELIDGTDAERYRVARITWGWVPPGGGFRPPLACETCGGAIDAAEGYWVTGRRTGRVRLQTDPKPRRRHAECHDPDGTA